MGVVSRWAAITLPLTLLIPLSCTFPDYRLADAPACAGKSDCNLPIACESGLTCESKVCKQNVCQEPACDDGTRNGGESDRDCGGGMCSPCGDGATCNVDTDCVSSACVSGVCLALHCTNRKIDADETGADCGGAECGACDTGSACGSDSDCISRICADNLCSEPRCDDAIRNGLETDVDCGGTACATACALGLTCALDTDCASGSCQQSSCAATLLVRYMTDATTVSTMEIHPIFELVNPGSSDVPLKDLAIRYYYTRDGAPSETKRCLSTTAPLTCDGVTQLFQPYAPSKPHADSYYQVGFTLGTLPAGQSITIDTAFKKSAGDYEQSGDYSWDPSKTQLTDHQLVTLHRDEILIWGQAP